MVTKRQNLAPVRSGKNCSGYGNGKKFITVHQTGNTNKGANAQMHANLQTRVWDASWHWQVDDKEAIQSFPHSVKCWHASDGERGDGNANSIGVEGCINSDGDYKKSVQNMAELVAWIAKEENIPVTNIKQHHDFARDKKNCPAQIRAGKEGINWTKFIQMVQAELDKLNGKIAVDSAKVHKVAKGDTLWSIAKKYGVSVDYLKSVNSLKSDLIVVGQSLSVAGSAPKPVPVAVAKPKPTKTIDQLAKEVIDGKHGNGDARKKSLGNQYTAVQKRVDEILAPKPKLKPNDTIAREVVQGLWGNGADRKARLEKAGYNYNTIQNLVNRMF